MQLAVPTVVMRGGTSKGLYFLREDLPDEVDARDRLLLAAMGSPDIRQIDGMGGAHPLTSKVAVVSRSQDSAADVDYLFLQVVVDKALVSDGQNCGNILAGAGQFAIEKGLVAAETDETTIRIRMLNSGGIAVVTVKTPAGQVTYEGDASIDGVPGTAAPVMIDFADVAGFAHFSHFFSTTGLGLGGVALAAAARIENKAMAITAGIHFFMLLLLKTNAWFGINWNVS